MPWLRDLLHRAMVRKARAAQEPVPYRTFQPEALLLTDFWIAQLLQHPYDCIYEVTRAEPFRLRAVRAGDPPITPALLNRTVTTVAGILEPEQPTLGPALVAALRTVTPDRPVSVRYRSTCRGQWRHALVMDWGEAHDRLYVHCSDDDAPASAA